MPTDEKSTSPEDYADLFVPRVESVLRGCRGVWDLSGCCFLRSTEGCSPGLRSREASSGGLLRVTEGGSPKETVEAKLGIQPGKMQRGGPVSPDESLGNLMKSLALLPRLSGGLTLDASGVDPRIGKLTALSSLVDLSINAFSGSPLWIWALGGSPP